MKKVILSLTILGLTNTVLARGGGHGHGSGADQKAARQAEQQKVQKQISDEKAAIISDYTTPEERQTHKREAKRVEKGYSRSDREFNRGLKQFDRAVQGILRGAHAEYDFRHRSRVGTRTAYYNTVIFNQNNYNVYVDRYAHMRGHGYRSGYSYGFRPIVNFTSEFTTAAILFWLYSDESNPIYSVFLPTEDLRSLSVEVSALDVYKQNNFKAALNSTAHQVLVEAQQKYLGAPYRLTSDDIVVTRQQVLYPVSYRYGSESQTEVLIEGFFEQNRFTVPFKALLNLDTGSSYTFVPRAGAGVVFDERFDSDLLTINARLALKGVIE